MNRVKRILANKYFILALRLYLGGLFMYASLYKISYAGEFAQSIAAYRVVPAWAVNPMAVVMPWLELITGGLLVVGIRTKAAAGIVAVLMAMFATAVGLALARGISMGCGCFTALEEPMDWTTLVRDLVWLAMALAVYFLDSAWQMERTFVDSLNRRMPA